MIKQFTAAICLVATLAACNQSNVAGQAKTDTLLTRPNKPMAATAQDGTNTANANTVTNSDAPAMKFENDVHDFGKIKEGDKVTYEFQFVNTGKSPLIITDATATCGCTKPEYNPAPVKPGDKGAIKVTFNSAGKNGMQDKMITITANTTPEQTMVHLTGEVLAPTTK